MSLQCFRLCLASYKQKQNNERKEYQQAPAQAVRKGSLRRALAGRILAPVSYSPAGGHTAPTLKALQGENKLVGLGLLFFLYFFFFLIAKREGWFQNQSVKADSWGGTFQIPSPPSMLDGIIIKPGLKGGKGAKEPQMTPSE